MSRMSDLAIEQTTLSELLEGREKMTTEDIIKEYPNGVTITEVDMITCEIKGEENTFPVCTFKENKTSYFFGGIVLKKIIKSWINACGTIEEVNKELAISKGVKIQLSYGKTKGNDQIVLIKVIE